MGILHVLGAAFIFIEACTPHREKPAILSCFPCASDRVQKYVPLPQKDVAKPVPAVFIDRTPLQEIFETVCQGHPITLAIHPSLLDKRGIAYRPCQTPLWRVIEDLCEMTGHRYRIRGTTLFIEEDTPFIQTHGIAFLLGSRQTHNQVTIMTDVLGNPEGKGGSNSSNTKLSASAVTDFWGELEQTLQMILQTHSPLPERLNSPPIDHFFCTAFPTTQSYPQPNGKTFGISSCTF